MHNKNMQQRDASSIIEQFSTMWRFEVIDTLKNKLKLLIIIYPAIPRVNSLHKDATVVSEC